MTDPADPAAVARDLAARRTSYETAGLDVGEVDADPMTQWHRWYADAVDASCVEPNAFVLATVDGAGYPQARYLLARTADADGFVFHTNYESAKSRQLDDAPRAAMLFTWLQLHRQVRVTGDVQRATQEESDAYFSSRPRDSQLSSWSSPQSQVVPDRAWLEQRVRELDATFSSSPELPRPMFWGGWRLRPLEWEFWQGRPNRLHDRVRYRRDRDGMWLAERLAP